MFTPKASQVLIDDGEFKEITIDKDKPRAIYIAAPLLTCFGILLRWNDKAILYHAPSGTPDPKTLKAFSEQIKKDQFDLANVDVVIACSDSLEKVKGTLPDCLSYLKTAGFSKQPEIKENQHGYSMDSFGNHAETLSAKEAKATGSSQVRRRSR
jgi:hypothetical protein